MAEPFIGEIKMTGFGFAPKGWALCDGATIQITQNPTLYSLIGTQFGGNGQTTFMLPDMRGRVPVHLSNYSSVGHKYGLETVALAESQIPTHTHTFNALNEPASASTVVDNLFANENNNPFYGAPENLVSLNEQSCTATGAGSPHTNMQPVQVISFAIALEGAYPSRS